MPNISPIPSIEDVWLRAYAGSQGKNDRQPVADRAVEDYINFLKEHNPGALAAMLGRTEVPHDDVLSTAQTLAGRMGGKFVRERADATIRTPPSIQLRTRRASGALMSYIRLKGEPWSDNAGDRADAIRDLISDLLHLAGYLGVVSRDQFDKSMSELLTHALANYEAERRE